ncbi:hypothetical protein WMF37_12125 [Sorangium sp. So ce291]
MLATVPFTQLCTSAVMLIDGRLEAYPAFVVTVPRTSGAHALPCVVHVAVVSSQGNVTRCTRIAWAVAALRFTERLAETMTASEGMDERSNPSSPYMRFELSSEVTPTTMLPAL